MFLQCDVRRAADVLAWDYVDWLVLQTMSISAEIFLTTHVVMLANGVVQIRVISNGVVKTSCLLEHKSVNDLRARDNGVYRLLPITRLAAVLIRFDNVGNVTYARCVKTELRALIKAGRLHNATHLLVMIPSSSPLFVLAASLDT